MQRCLGLAALIALVAMVAMVAVPVGAAMSTAPTMHATSRTAFFDGTTSESSYNWAGYAESSGVGTVTQVTGSWTQPSVTCGKGTALAAFWVGIDGLTSDTVEQDGTLAQCSSHTATYYAWWETYPANSVQEFGTIHAGDQFTASVTYDSSTLEFTMTIKDTTSGKSWTEVSTNEGAEENSAECITERPAGADNASGLYALAKFGTVSFGSCGATVSGTTGGIGSFSSVYKLTMVNYSSGTRDLAKPSSLTDNSAFTVTWKHYA
jgi:hypothetical protein